MTERLSSASTAVSADRAPTPTTMAFVSDHETEDLVRAALGDLGIDDADIARGTVVTATAALARRKTPRLLIVDISGVENPLLRIHELAEMCEPEVNVVTIGDRNDILLYQELKTAGVAEYFFKPLVRDTLKRSCNMLLKGACDEKPANSNARKARVRAGRARRRRRHHDRGERRQASGPQGSEVGDAGRPGHGERRRRAPARRKSDQRASRGAGNDRSASTSCSSNAERFMRAIVSTCWRASSPSAGAVALNEDTILSLTDKLLHALSFRVCRSAHGGRGEPRSMRSIPPAPAFWSAARRLASARDTGALAGMDRAELSGATHDACAQHERRRGRASRSRNSFAPSATPLTSSYPMIERSRPRPVSERKRRRKAPR